ncbi:Protein NLRC5 [Holothuria leucospilota]|uniref:Protein NLRC5 n=1 Tax=Holothuria leucospilota TaxID=206669 RepID=A0A9Q1CQC5_HOLLE|nr:Protein NLRC5 [Holothuria leucospilota]
MTLKGALLIALICVIECDLQLMCDTPQYVERGEKGILECDFPKVFYGVFWYNSSDHLQTDPVAYLKYSDNGRERYESNGYSILLDGSFVINNVTLQHERNFTAAILYSTEDPYYPNYIHVVVTVKPNQPYPYIKDCNENERVCFMKLDQNYELSCSVKGARPAVHLNWYIKSVANDRVLHSEGIVTSANTLYTSWVTTLYNVSHSTGTVVYVCNSINKPFLLTHEYSVILIQNLRQRYDDVEPETIYAKYLTSIELHCTNQTVLYLIWKKQSPTNYIENLVDSLFLHNTSYTNYYSNNFYLTKRRSLRINEVEVSYEGVYICNFGDGISETTKMLNLQVYVLPNPPHLIIEGCSHHYYCELSIPTEGEVTCVVKGIRPQVKLRWEVVRDDQKHFINFSKSDQKIIENGFEYDIYLTSHFHIQDSVTERFAIRCKTWHLHEIPFHLSTEIYLKPLQVKVTETPAYPVKGPGNREIATYSIVSFIVIALIIGIVTRSVVLKRRNQHTTFNELESEQELGLMRPTKEKIAIFKHELQQKYQRTWKTLRPVPYNREVNYTVNEIYVASDIQCLEKVVYGEDGKLPVWQKIRSHNFVELLCQNSQRLVLEGEPGYGKTYLGYLFAYEWSTKNANSPMKAVDIYILLRLRYLKDISSISKAIKKILLPANSSITDEDVASILFHSNSVVMYLDGFDRYFRDDDFRTTLMNDVYLNTISPNCTFILTTTPYCRPDEHYEVTTYVRLTGFSATNWKEYLQRAVWSMNTTERKTIINILQENQFLLDLCQVPLFFVLFAHICKDDGTLRRGKFKTVTEFVRTLINCVHDKMGTVVDEHSAIKSLCLNALSGNGNFGVIWTKDEICRTLGEHVYEEYREVGILVEKTFGTANPGSHPRGNKGAQHYTMVRFFHGIFCQWYAAQELVEVFKKSNQEYWMGILQRINPCDHQYVYRFACGMDGEVAKKIVGYLCESLQEDKFTILCIQEQTGNFGKLKETIKQICLSSVSIKAYDTLFLQRSTVELLQYAASDNITIEKVLVGQKNSTFDFKQESLKLHPGLFLPKLSTLRCLSLRDPGREVSKPDFQGLLQFASLCQSLKRIRFQDCMLPFLQPKDLQRERTSLDEKEVDVFWKTPVHGCDWYSLDLKSGEWHLSAKTKREGEIMSKKQYAKMVQSFKA